MDYVDSCRRQLERSGFALTKIYGKSMRPLIWGGEHCVAVTPLAGEPMIGDLLAFRNRHADGEEVGVVHRLVEIRQAGDQRLYITRGDNCLGCETVERAKIIGRVAEVHRLSGFRPWHIIPAKRFAVTDPAYLRYVRLWATIWPLRRFYYRLRGMVNGLRARVLSIFKNR